MAWLMSTVDCEDELPPNLCDKFPSTSCETLLEIRFIFMLKCELSGS